MSSSDAPILIAGAGIGGLALAHRLEKAGTAFRVLEAQPAISSRGQGYRLSLKKQGVEALRQCLPGGLFDLAVAAAIAPATRLVFADPHLRARVDKPLPVPSPGPDGFGINRITLREILLTHVEDRVSFAHRVTGFTASRGEVNVEVDGRATLTGRLLVGADGTRSAVRRQLLPQAKLEVLGQAIHGKTPITEGLLEELDPRLVDTFNQVKDTNGAGFSVATCRPLLPLSEAVQRHAPGARLSPIADYLQWIVATPAPLPTEADPTALHRLATDTVATWHPSIRRILASARVQDTFAVTIHSALPVKAWPQQGITLLGDAIHTMSPGRGDGANTALRDAAVLGQQIVRSAPGDLPTLRANIGAYEQQMLDYGFRAVTASRTAPFSFNPTH